MNCGFHNRISFTKYRELAKSKRLHILFLCRTHYCNLGVCFTFEALACVAFLWVCAEQSRHPVCSTCSYICCAQISPPAWAVKHIYNLHSYRTKNTNCPSFSSCIHFTLTCCYTLVCRSVADIFFDLLPHFFCVYSSLSCSDFIRYVW